MMPVRPDCFGNFNFNSEECAVCSNHNLDCIIKSLQGELCFTNALLGEHFEKCDVPNCQPQINTKCTSARHILDKMKEKNCFSKPSIKAECFKCNLFKDCEAADLIRQNFNLTFFEAKRLIKSQISEMLKEEGQCFGDFSFEKACWGECQWTVRCMESSGIIPGKDCKFFPIKDGPKAVQCASCDFKDFCFHVFESKLKEEEKALEATKIFRSFYSVNQMREFTEVTK